MTSPDDLSAVAGDKSKVFDNEDLPSPDELMKKSKTLYAEVTDKGLFSTILILFLIIAPLLQTPLSCCTPRSSTTTI